ncbi:ArsR/SmtB family transcription factor [Maritalea sp.]|jgi:DNA-binding transcriptional ArsR family regulator|uniref:ArsR/SmtB family transcription factor n=1 Tax=Maritalea sp. TaxID=2003361 RepID=UPI0039E375DA
MTYETVYNANDKMWAALGDPTRRAIFEIVSDRHRGVQEIADVLPVTRPAVSQHLKLLDEAGLVQAHKVGRQRIYSANPKALKDLRDWLDQYWTDAMHNFAQAADKDEEKQND